MFAGYIKVVDGPHVAHGPDAVQASLSFCYITNTWVSLNVLGITRSLPTWLYELPHEIGPYNVTCFWGSGQ